MIINKLIIIGSGPAGYTAAIYAARANLNPILITGNSPGGQLTSTNEIDNWPGEYNTINGFTLMTKIYKHVLKFNIKIFFDHINQVCLFKPPYILLGKNKYICEALIIATGTSPKSLGLKEEQKYKFKGISNCAICDGFFYKNLNVAVIGGGNTAFENALYLSNIVNKVYLIHRNNIFKADKILINKILKIKNIIIFKNYILKNILGNDKKITNINIINNNNIINLEINGLFISIGSKPNTYLFKNKLNLINDYIKIKYNGYITGTSIKGIFAAGDVIYQKYRQAIIAAGSGCLAALDVENYLNNLF